MRQECQDTTQQSEEVWETFDEPHQSCNTWLLTCTAQQCREITKMKEKLLKMYNIAGIRPNMGKVSCLNSQ